MRARIISTGFAVPDKVLTNHDLERMVDTSDEWIRERTGMSERRISDAGTAASDLAYDAAQLALAEAGASASDLDAIICATISPDYIFPSTACVLQNRLGVRSITAFDISAACSGYLYGLSIVSSFIETGRYSNVLLVGVDLLSKVVDWTDRNTCVLFGDGAGASLLQPDEESGVLDSVLGADGQSVELLYQPCGGSRHPINQQNLENGKQYLYMNGKEIFKHAVREMANSCTKVLERAQLSIDDVKLVIPHQANIRIIEAVANRLELSMDRFYINIQKYANTSAATIPIALHEARSEGKLQSGDIVLMTAFGAGLTWGACLVRL